jgi:putative ABC transport system substrate-binding protein
MRRRDFVTMLGATVAWPAMSAAKPARKPLRIGMLETVPLGYNAAQVDAFQRGMQALGYLEGKDYAIEYRSADGRVERFPELATELIRRNVDVIVARGTPATLAARNASRSIPVVMSAVGDPVGAAVVANLARPGGNVTGLSSFTTVLQSKKVEILHELIPSIRRVGAMLTMSNPVTPSQWGAIRNAAEALGLQARLFDLRGPEDIDAAFRAAAADGVGGLVFGLGSLIQANRQAVVEQAARHRIPAIFHSREFVEAGGLISYGVSYLDLYFRAASYVDKIARGARPGDLAIGQPTKFELVFNLRTAKSIGLTISESFLIRADEVIE